MMSLKLELCLALTLYLVAFHRAASQCLEFAVPPMDTVAPMNSMTCLTCDYPDRTDEEWFRDGTSILPGSESDSCDCEVFPNEGTICFNSVSATDVGEYSCEVQIGFGQICSSSAAQLTLAELPVIDEITDPIRVVEEETATIPVSVTGLPDPMVQFIRDGEVLTNGSRITVGERELVISDVDMEDRGFYSIRANNSAGVDTHTRTLLVEFVPSVTVEQSDEVNGMVTLTCTAVSYPMPDLNRWERSSDDMPLIGVEEFTTTDFDFTVVITVTVPCVSGGYFCVVGNDRGIKRTGITCGEGPPNPPTINVAIESTTSVIVTWDSVTEPTATNYTIQYRVAGSSAYMSRTILDNGGSNMERIGELRREAEYEFRAASANSAGRGEFGMITTLKLPAVAVVTGVLVTENVVNNERGISITWDDYPDPGDGYLIVYSISGVAQQSISVGPAVTSFLLEVPDSCSSIRKYTFSIRAMNQFELDTASNTVELEVNCAFSSRVVTIRNVVPFGTALTVMWRMTAGATVEGLVISVTEVSSPDGDIKGIRNYTVPGTESSRRSLCVGGLTLKTTYEVCIVANVSGRAEESDCAAMLVRTLEEDTMDVSSCVLPTSGYSQSSGGIPDWSIAVIVVGALSIVALVFCFMGICFACHNSHKKGEVDYGSKSIEPPTKMMNNVKFPKGNVNCLSRSKGHSTRWSEHIMDTVKELESGVPTAV